MLVTIEHSNRVAIRHYISVETPVSSNGVTKKFGISTSRDAINLIVRAHNTCHLPFPHTFSEWYVKCVHYILFAHLSIEVEAINAAPIIKIIGSVVLTTSRHFQPVTVISL
uniref:Uncharacterized protein n=1 Tax=Opuntia streptacantha TaxID=393608 RepID=A0A7C9E503_OPUST